MGQRRSRRTAPRPTRTRPCLERPEEARPQINRDEHLRESLSGTASLTRSSFQAREAGLSQPNTFREPSRSGRRHATNESSPRAQDDVLGESRHQPAGLGGRLRECRQPQRSPPDRGGEQEEASSRKSCHAGPISSNANARRAPMAASPCEASPAPARHAVLLGAAPSASSLRHRDRHVGQPLPGLRTHMMRLKRPDAP